MNHATLAPRSLRWPQRLLAAACVIAILGATIVVAGCSASGSAEAQTNPPRTELVVPKVDLAALTGNQRLEHLAEHLTSTRADRARMPRRGPFAAADPESELPPYSELLVKIWGAGTAVEYHKFVDDSGTMRFGTVRKQPSMSKHDFTMAKADMDFLPYPAEVIDYRCLTITRSVPVLYGANPVEEMDWYLSTGGSFTADTSPTVKIDTATTPFFDHVIPPDTRRALWLWLARIPGWTVRDGADLIGRPGLVFELQDGDNRNELIIDGATGDLLSLHVDYGAKSLKHLLRAWIARAATYPPSFAPKSGDQPFNPHTFYRNCPSPA